MNNIELYEKFNNELWKIPKIIKKEIVDANILEIAVGTTGKRGGGWGDGSRHYLKLENAASTAWMVRVTTKLNEPMEIRYIYNKEGEKLRVYTFDFPRSVEILLGGDAELNTFLEALKIAYKILTSQSRQRK